MEPVMVTAAIIMKDGQVLIAQRSEEGRHPGKWEFPGGKVEEGETPEECLAREMEEEMGMGIRVGRKLGSVEYSYSDMDIELIAFQCTIARGEIRHLGCSDHAWVNLAELLNCDLLPADMELARGIFPENVWISP